MAKPYERLPEESNKAYEAFALYRDMGTNRTQEKVLQQIGKNAGYLRQLQEWSGLYHWVERAAAYDAYIDAEARKKAERAAINRRAEMLQRHALTGKVMQQKGINYLDKNGVDKSSDAIAAIAKGIEIERKTEGLPDWMFEMVNVDDDELQRRYAELLASISFHGSGDDPQGDAPAGTDTAETPTETDD